MNKYIGFTSKKDISELFDVCTEFLDKYKILFAGYYNEDYSGIALVILKEKSTNNLYQVFGSHCSCNGLEGQFELEETNIKHIKKLLKEGYTYKPFEYEVKQVLEKLSI